MSAADILAGTARVDVSRWFRLCLLVAAAAVSALGLAILLAAATGTQVHGGLGARIVFGVLGLVLTVVGAGLVYWRFAHPRRKELLPCLRGDGERDGRTVEVWIGQLPATRRAVRQAFGHRLSEERASGGEEHGGRS